MIVLPVVYWKTFRALRLHNNQVQDVANDEGRQQTDVAHKNRERNMIFTFLVILVLYYLPLTPQFIAINLLIFNPEYINLERFRLFMHVSNKCVLINCCLNPFIYAWRIPTYRKAFKAVFSGCVRLPRNNVSMVMPTRVVNRSDRTGSTGP